MSRTIQYYFLFELKAPGIGPFLRQNQGGPSQVSLICDIEGDEVTIPLVMNLNEGRHVLPVGTGMRRWFGKQLIDSNRGQNANDASIEYGVLSNGTAFIGKSSAGDRFKEKDVAPLHLADSNWTAKDNFVGSVSSLLTLLILYGDLL